MILQQLLSNDRDFLYEKRRREDRDLRFRAGGGVLLDLGARNSEDLDRIQKLKNLAEKAKWI